MTRRPMRHAFFTEEFSNTRGKKSQIIGTEIGCTRAENSFYYALIEKEIGETTELQHNRKSGFADSIAALRAAKNKASEYAPLIDMRKR